MSQRFSYCLLVVCYLFSLSVSAGTLDMIAFADEQSGDAHGLKVDSGRVVIGGMGQQAIELLPPTREGWRGGTLTFEVAVDPDQPNYFTAKFWGGDVASSGEQRLCLFIDGKQVGQRHLGEVEMLDIMYTEIPRYPDRFYYKTTPLPLNITRGKKSVELTIEAQGGINGYAGKIEQYQKAMTEPSRGIYRGYVHTEPYLVPSPDEVQGSAREYPVRPTPGPEVIKKLKDQLNGLSDKLMRSTGDHHQDAIQYMGHAYHVPWNSGYHNPKMLKQIVRGLDGEYLEYRDNPELIEKIHWVAKGPAGDAVYLMAKELQPFLDKRVEGERISRRKAWADMFVAARDWNVAHRRSYTNQSMIVDLNTYYCHLAVKVIDRRRAWPEKKAVRLLHESMGLELWSGDWSESLKPSWNQGRSKLLLTEEGLTRELGYVGAYGEIVTDFGLMMYEATKRSPDADGDPRLKEQLVKMTKARAAFRYPLIDADGYRSMNLESVVGWRDWHHPGGVIYDQTNGRDGGAFEVAISTMDPVLMGYGQQMVEDNQFFAALDNRLGIRHTNSKTFLLSVPENYEKIVSLPPQETRLPMSVGQPDFVFADPTTGVIAVKQGEDLLYASLYWRARYAINNLARVHYLTPTIERDATVHIKTRFRKSPHVYTVPDQTNEPFNKRHEDFYQKAGMRLAVAGEKQPIAMVPKDEAGYKPGKENIYAGKGDFYEMTYGPYFVVMNCTAKKSFVFDVPEDFRGAIDLVTGNTVDSSDSKLAPMQTIVLYREPITDEPS